VFFLLSSTDTSLDSSGVDISSPKKSNKKKHKEHRTPVKQYQQQHGDSLQTPNTSSVTDSKSSHKKHRRKRRHGDDSVSVKHQKLDSDAIKDTNTPATPSTTQTDSDIVSSPFKTKHKKHKSKMKN